MHEDRAEGCAYTTYSYVNVEECLCIYIYVHVVPLHTPALKKYIQLWEFSSAVRGADRHNFHIGKPWPEGRVQTNKSSIHACRCETVLILVLLLLGLVKSQIQTLAFSSIQVFKLSNMSRLVSTSCFLGPALVFRWSS